jgi:hypothetical protein
MGNTDLKRAADAPPAPRALQGQDAFACAVCALVRAARRELSLFAPQLAVAPFATAAVTAALGQFLTAHPRNRLRLLIEDETQVRRDHERLLALARRAGEQFELRVLDESDGGTRELWLLADRAGALWQEDLAREDGRTCTPAEAVRLAGRFDDAWERGRPTALNALGLAP